VEVGGLDIEVWVELFMETYDNTGIGLIKGSYPDGLPYMKQDYVLLCVFGLIYAIVKKEQGPNHG